MTQALHYLIFNHLFHQTTQFLMAVQKIKTEVLRCLHYLCILFHFSKAFSEISRGRRLWSSVKIKYTFI